MGMINTLVIGLQDSQSRGPSTNPLPFCPIPFCPIPFCPSTILSIPLCPYHFVHHHFCPIPFCPSTILSIPLCPYHFVHYHFVRSPLGVSLMKVERTEWHRKT